MFPRTNCPYCSYPLLIRSASGTPQWFCQHCFRDIPYGIDSLLASDQGGDASPDSPIRDRFDCSSPLSVELTQQKQDALQYELEKLRQLKEDFLNTTSHELRTPLSNMRLAIQMLELLLRREGLITPTQADASNNPVGIADYLTVLNDECEQEIRLINDLLALQQLEAGTQVLLPMQLPLQAWIVQAIAPFRAQISNRRQQLHLDVSADLPPLTTDFTLLERLLSELLSNACKFSPKDECITVAVSALAGQIQIQVTNSGVEIPNDELSRIFDKFYRIPSDNPWRHSGTGLGLALAKALVIYLGGAIAVESQAEQTCFTVTIPCPESQVVTPNDMLMSYVAYYLSRGKTILSPKQGVLPFEGEVYQYCGYHRDFLNFWQRLVTRHDFPELHLQGDSHAFRQFLGGEYTVTECARCRLPIPTAEGHVPSTPSCELCPDPRTLQQRPQPTNQRSDLQFGTTQVLVIGAQPDFDSSVYESLAVNGFAVTYISVLEAMALEGLPTRVNLVLINADVSEAEAEVLAKMLVCYPQLDGAQIVALSSQNRFSLPWAERELTVEDYLLSPLGGDRLAQHLEQLSCHQSASSPALVHWFPQ